MDKNRVEKLIRELIIEIGEDPTREGLRETPARIAKAYKEIFEGYDSNSELSVQFSDCLLYTSPSPRDRQKSRMPSSA